MTKIELLVIVETLKDFKGMLWGKKMKVYSDNQNLPGMHKNSHLIESIDGDYFSRKLP